VNVQHRIIRQPARIAVIDSAIPAQGWMVLDLQRTLKELSGLFSEPVTSFGSRMTVPVSALGSAAPRPAALPPLMREADRPASRTDAPRPASVVPLSTSKRLPAPKPQPPRRVPDADIVFLGRRPPSVAAVVPAPDIRSAPVPKIQTEVRPWLAVLSALAFAGLGFYFGTKWGPRHVIEVPAALDARSTIV